MVIYSAGAERRDRMLIAAVWLIALGSLFLVKELAGWEWNEAWPLWVIFVGVGTAGSALFSRRRSPVGLWGIWSPLAVIVVGLVLLASTTGMIAISPNQLIAWWPVAVIVLGIWFLFGALIARPGEAQSETLNVPLAGVTQAEVRVHFGGGELVIGQAEPGALISGRFEGGVIQRTRGPGQVDLESYGGGWAFWWDRPLHWTVGLTSEVPVDLSLESGANRSNIDLTALRIRRLELKTGASQTHIRLPAAGATSVRAEAGVAALTIEVPQGVAARIHSKLALGSTNIDEQRFPRSLDGWVSPDYETAANRVEIEVKGGVGSIRVF